MQLIGMLDSPYVRRVAVSLQLLGLPFEHEPLSVFRAVNAFRRINPVVKAPTLVCDDGTVLMDSTLILHYAQALAGSARRLQPGDAAELARTLRIMGLALAACEKSVQIVYERHVRPAEKFHGPWIERVAAQLSAAYAGLEHELGRHPLAVTQTAITQDGIDVAVAWQFTQKALPGQVDPAAYPALRAHSRNAEALPVFAAAPHGAGTYRADAA